MARHGTSEIKVQRWGFTIKPANDDS